jgi:RHS repeat-associated protein
VGNRELAAYEYLAGNGLLSKQTYGNGHEVRFTYDDLGRTKTVTYSNVEDAQGVDPYTCTLYYAYTGDGQLHSVTERKNGGTTTTYLYQYDTLGNLVGSVKLVGGSPVLRTYHSYNDDNKLSSQGWQIGSDSFTQTYTYGAWDGNLSSLVVSDNNSTTSDITVSYSYDGLRRLSSVDNGILSREYSYNSNGTQTTAQVGTLTYTGLSSNFTYSYAYDVSGNIHTYSDSNGEVTYTYDAQGQLTKAVIGSTTYRYSYDNAGNILTANGHTYTYGNPSWADLLTAYDGILISYDEIGNPESYYNGKHWEFDWIQGRQLKRAYTTSPTEDTTIDYTYDADGLRTGKIVTVETFSEHPHTYTASSVVEPTCTTRGYTIYICTCGKQIQGDYVAALGHNYSVSNVCKRCGHKLGDSGPINPILPPGGNITMGGDGSDATEVMSTSSTEGRTLESTKRMEYQYIYAGTKLVRLVVTTRMNNGTPTTQTLDFTYDAGGIPLTVTTGGAVYYYITNLQGDVMAITNSSGTAVVKYRYDPYGKLISTTGSKASTLGKVNPLTYRSYVYDTESTLYYLQSRYYDPSIGRFINADALVSTGQGVLGNNMFTYCGNNPCDRCDPDGYLWVEFVIMMVAIACCATGCSMEDTNCYVYALRKDTDPETGKPIKKAADPGGFSTNKYHHYLLSFVSNTDEQVALEADCFAFYKGVPVIKVDALGTSGLSLGFIFLGSKVRSPEVIQHEYGHTVQLSQIGVIDYLIFVGAPSKFYFDKTQQGVYSWSEYYDRPWELLADCFGQVDRTYLPNVQRNAEFYWLIARICSKLT